MKINDKRILVTAALPYANGNIHLGHLAGAYLPADIYVRYQRLKKRDVVFLCGSDEHGVPIMVTADKEKTTPQAVVDQYHEENKKAFAAFGMSFDNYSRTSLPLHHATAQEFFREFYDRHLLIEKQEEQLFCEKDRMFLADRYVEGICPNCKSDQARGDQCENCGNWLNQKDLINPKCKICGSKPIIRTTSHWYFPLGKFQQRLEDYIKERNARNGWKDNVLKYCENWFKEGLTDRAVTRDISWGVKVPVKGYEDKVLYVWFDAVLGYISSTKEWANRQGTPERWKDYWLNSDTKYVAFIGKDNVVFHCIVFPAMLMAWNDGGKSEYILPENVPANEFLNFEGKKFSKSRGWGIDLKDFLRHFPADFLRYALAVNLPEYRDSDFYLKDFQARTNNELADIVGNFINRTLAFADRHFGNTVPPAHDLQENDEEMIRRLEEWPAKVGTLYEQYRFRDGLFEVMNLARLSNKYFNDGEPWKTIKSNPSQCSTTIHICLRAARTLAILLEPVTPQISRKLWNILRIASSIEKAGWDGASKLGMKVGHRLGNAEILIKKIEDIEIENIIKTLEDNHESPSLEESQIDIEFFKKLDLRIAEVVKAERIQKSEKLIRLEISIGQEKRQIVAGIAQHYKAEDLVGKKIVVVANLKPAKVMGNESKGMLLAAHGDGKLSILTLDVDVPSGSTVK